MTSCLPKGILEDNDCFIDFGCEWELHSITNIQDLEIISTYFHKLFLDKSSIQFLEIKPYLEFFDKWLFNFDENKYFIKDRSYEEFILMYGLPYELGGNFFYDELLTIAHYSYHKHINTIKKILSMVDFCLKGLKYYPKFYPTKDDWLICYNNFYTFLKSTKVIFNILLEMVYIIKAVSELPYVNHNRDYDKLLQSLYYPITGIKDKHLPTTHIISLNWEINSKFEAYKNSTPVTDHFKESWLIQLQKELIIKVLCTPAFFEVLLKKELHNVLAFVEYGKIGSFKFDEKLSAYTRLKQISFKKVEFNKVSLKDSINCQYSKFFEKEINTVLKLAGLTRTNVCFDFNFGNVVLDNVNLERFYGDYIDDKLRVDDNRKVIDLIFQPNSKYLELFVKHYNFDRSLIYKYDKDQNKVTFRDTGYPLHDLTFCRYYLNNGNNIEIYYNYV